MARIKLDIPDNSLAVIEVRVRVTDMNYGNHLGNDALVSILHEARAVWLKQLGLSELNIGGASLIMADLAVVYKQESYFGDLLKVRIVAGEVSKAGFELYYEVIANRGEQTMLIAQAKTGMVCYDYEKKKVSALPQSFAAILSRDAC
jgi:acyl-CoA thioester hydrolase